MTLMLRQSEGRSVGKGEDPLAEYEAWERWLDRIPEDQRSKAAELAHRYDLSTKAGMAKYVGDLHDLVLRGVVSPTVARMLQSLLKDQLTLIYLMHQESNSTSRIGVSYRKVITEIQERTAQIRPTYIEDKGEMPDVLEARKAVAALGSDDE